MPGMGCDNGKKNRRRKRMPGEVGEDQPLTLRAEMDSVLKSILDRLSMELGNRFRRLKDLDNSLGFLLDVEGLITSEEDLREKCETAAVFYSDDFDGAELCHEIEDCRILLRTRRDTDSDIKTPETPLELFKFLV